MMWTSLKYLYEVFSNLIEDFEIFGETDNEVFKVVVYDIFVSKRKLYEKVRGKIPYGLRIKIVNGNFLICLWRKLIRFYL